LASVVGTLELLEPDERALVKGIIINKFRGDLDLLKPALDFLEAKTGKPVIGVVPHLDQLGIDDEDSVSLDDKQTRETNELDIAVLRTPKISNFTDFDALASEEDVAIRYIRPGEAIGKPDLIILPGSKNTIEDLSYLRKQGYEQEIINLVNAGTPLIGICGGYQMLGKEIYDPEHTESELDSITGIGLLDIATTFAADKVTHQVTACCKDNGFLGINSTCADLTGYEIHMGRTEFLSPVEHAFTITSRSGETTQSADGVVRADGLVMGTYIHGIFDNDVYRRNLLNALRVSKGLAPIDEINDTYTRKQNSYNRLADTVRHSLNMELVYEMMEAK
jgi:adenosylcobyric acid synthase